VCFFRGWIERLVFCNPKTLEKGSNLRIGPMLSKRVEFTNYLRKLFGRFLSIYVSFFVYLSLSTKDVSWKSERFFWEFFWPCQCFFLASEWYSQNELFSLIHNHLLVICYCYGRTFGGNTTLTMGWWTNRKRNSYGFVLYPLYLGERIFLLPFVVLNNCKNLVGSEGFWVLQF